MTRSRTREVYRSVLERVRATPGIETAALSSTVPFGNFHEGRYVERPGIPRDENLPGRPTGSSPPTTSSRSA